MKHLPTGGFGCSFFWPSQEALAEGSWIDAETLVPPAFSAQDTAALWQALLQKLPSRSLGGQHPQHLVSGGCVFSEAFLNKLFETMLPKIEALANSRAAGASKTPASVAQGPSLRPSMEKNANSPSEEVRRHGDANDEAAQTPREGGAAFSAVARRVWECVFFSGGVLDGRTRCQEEEPQSQRRRACSSSQPVFLTPSPLRLTREGADLICPNSAKTASRAPHSTAAAVSEDSTPCFSFSPEQVEDSQFAALWSALPESVRPQVWSVLNLKAQSVGDAVCLQSRTDGSGEPLSPPAR